MRKLIVILAFTSCAILLNIILSSISENTIFMPIKGYILGSRGSQVSYIQSSLKDLGYYKGSINGTYGSDTKDAVKGFQSANGIKSDGVVNAKTLEKLNLYVEALSPGSSAKAKSNYSSKDLNLLARAINGEGRGEPYTGQVAIGGVIMNRSRDPRFPNTVAGVIYQPGAFTAVTDGQIDSNMEPQSTKAARDALNGWDPSGGAVYYFNPSKSTNKWIWSRPLIKVIGKHRFCK